MGTQTLETGTGASWVREARSAAFARFKERGYPTVRDEAWRETSVAEIARTPFERAGEAHVSEASLRELGLPELDGPRVVFVNSRFVPALSRLEGAPVAPLHEVIATAPERLESTLFRIASDERSSFVSLNTAMLDEGVVVDVPAGVRLEHPIHVAWVSLGEGVPRISHPRTVVLLGTHSEATVVESFVGVPGRRDLTNAVTEIRLGEESRLEHVKLQLEGDAAFHVSAIAASQARGSRFASRHFAFGAALARTDIDQRFDGEGGECELDGLFLARGDQKLDTHSRIDHKHPRCTSRELYKGIVDGRARGVFHGLVRVRKDAQKTDARQSNPNLLLSKDALVHSTPQLEILADDVKCKHGSTIGQLDPAALFYLRSRGIAEPQARGLLTWAFAGEVVRRVGVAGLRPALESHLARLLPGAPDRTEAA
jgi:Fe-S cluster assembly protein SufD